MLIVCFPHGEFNRSVKPMRKIRQVNGKIGDPRRAATDRMRAGEDAVTADGSDQLA